MNGDSRKGRPATNGGVLALAPKKGCGHDLVNHGGNVINVDIPGRGTLQLETLVLDFNGTLACDGKLLDGVEERLNELSRSLSIHILTADTFGHCREACRNLRVSVHVLQQDRGGPEKESWVASLGAQHTVAIGNGANDVMMLEYAELGIAVLGPEGASTRALLKADIAVRHIQDALDLLLHPQRLVATLRE